MLLSSEDVTCLRSTSATIRSTLQLSNSSGFYPRPDADGAGTKVVLHAGAVVLTETLRATGLDSALSTALQPWRPPTAVHDPTKVLCDLALALAAGGDCLADIALVRAEPGVFGLVASDPTVSRLISRLAADADDALAAISAARAGARERVWHHAGVPVQNGRVVIDLDATLVTAHSTGIGTGSRSADVL